MQTEHKFAWKCSYMGCDWWIATGPGFKDRGEELERRTMVGEYELSIANGDQVRAEMKSCLATIRRRNGKPLPDGAVSAFNAQVEAEHADAVSRCAAMGIDAACLPHIPLRVTDRYAA